MVTSSQLVAPQLMTMDEVASAVRCSVRTVMRAIQQKKLRSVRIGRAVRVRVDDLRAYIDARS